MRTKQKLSKYGHITREDLLKLRIETDANLHGRGARSNTVGRYETVEHEPFDDGWTRYEAVEFKPEPPVTEISSEAAKTIITRHKSPDLSFGQSVNPYRGCEHGCIYCYARPSHSYLGLSAGLDFETKISFKPDAPALLLKAFAKKNYIPEPIVIGSNTDCYQPVEKDLALTRALLEIMTAHKHPVVLITKSALILRDLDILTQLAEENLVRVAISLTSLDKTLARRMEPRAAAPHRRLSVITKPAKAGIPVSVMSAPLIPMLNEPDLETLLAAASEAGASRANYVILRLPFELKDVFHEWLYEFYPDRATRVINLLRQMHQGKDYDANWYTRRSGTGEYAKLIAQRFEKACKRLDLNAPRNALSQDKFIRPLPKKDDTSQLSFKF